mmetsp:Transcript_17365/g.37641  ORF Transcript_17365/g.37641 Transcript_17365/m.37641 type:complete len:106 (+) Transcript_17365:283-600(+)
MLRYIVQTKEQKLTNNGIHFGGMSEYDTRSTNGQKDSPAAQAPGKSCLIFANQFDSEKVPDCTRLLAKKTQVKDGPNNSWPSAAFCNVDTRDVPGRTLNMVSYQA